MTLRILAIGAHLDDIELGCGGTLARAARAGHCVHMICLSDSAYSNYDGAVLRTRDEALREGRDAARALMRHPRDPRFPDQRHPRRLPRRRGARSPQP